jgi:2-oxoglutarate/2-oxoacid ferredoxin oxidoreductase subunit alpha
MSMSEEKRLMKGNEAIGEAAIRAGCDAYFGYPITPQNELTAYMARYMLDGGRVFIQAESEVSAMSMVYGASAAGGRAMTSSSSPGISLKQEGISYASGADVPCVVVNIQRAGPGLGGISPSQGDYFQATRGGGHGDYYNIVLAPKSVQEAADLTYEAFELAEAWRTPVIVLADGLIGQMMEGVVLPPARDAKKRPDRPWAAGGRPGRSKGGVPAPANHICSMILDPPLLEKSVRARYERYERIAEECCRFEAVNVDKADLVFVAYGTSSRVCLGAIQLAKQEGLELGLLRPITLWPFPSAALAALAGEGKRFLAVEMSMGQMVEDVRLAVDGAAKVDFYGRCGGVIPSEEEVLAAAKRLLAGASAKAGAPAKS